MKNNAKVCDVRSLTFHWNISEMVYSAQWISLIFKEIDEYNKTSFHPKNL